MNPPLAFHREATAVVAASPLEVFAFLDDHQRLSAHMEKPSLMMAGATMKTEIDSQRDIKRHLRNYHANFQAAYHP